MMNFYELYKSERGFGYDHAVIVLATLLGVNLMEILFLVGVNVSWFGDPRESTASLYVRALIIVIPVQVILRLFIKKEGVLAYPYNPRYMMIGKIIFPLYVVVSILLPILIAR
jgi:hypothetical protein